MKCFIGGGLGNEESAALGAGWRGLETEAEALVDCGAVWQMWEATWAKYRRTHRDRY